MGKSVNIDIDLDEDAAAPAGTEDDVVDVDSPAAGRASDPDVVDIDVDPNDRLPPQAIQNADGSVTLPLRYPQELQVRMGGKVRVHRYAELTFHRLNGADQRAIAAASEEMMSVVAFARSTRILQVEMNKLFDKLDGADISAGGQVLNSFFASGRRTGR